MSKLYNDDYKRPKHTKTDKLTSKEKEKLLEGFSKVDNNKISKIPILTFLRYVVRIKDKKRKTSYEFKYGGYLIKINKTKGYLVLSTQPFGTPGKTWSAQMATSIFYRKVKEETEIETEISQALDKELEKKYKKLEKKYKETKKLNQELVNKVIELKKRNKK